MKAAWSCVKQHRWRSCSALAVCAAGTAGVLVAAALSEIQVADVEERLRNMGGRLLVVSPGTLPPYPGRTRQLEHFISLVEEDGAALAREVPGVGAVVPVAARSAVVRLESRAARVRLIGTTAGYLRLRRFRTAAGRFLSATDEGDKVIVLGHAVARELDAHGIRPGQTIALGAAPYHVVGILAPQGVNFAGEDEDRQVFIPLETYRRRIANRPWLTHLYVELARTADVTRTASDVQQLLRGRHGQWRDEADDVIVRDFAQLTTRQSDLLATTTWVVFVTSGLLLAVGMVGIMSLMLLLVRQRRSEIGLRRALGAVPADVAFQFFLEGSGLAAAGVLAGCVLGFGTAVALARGWGVEAELNLLAAAISLVVSLGSGAVACALPAILAARIEPAIALRR